MVTSSSLFALRPWISRIVIFHLVCLAWIFFRAESVHAAFAMLGGLRTFAWAPEIHDRAPVPRALHDSACSSWI